MVHLSLLRPDLSIPRIKKELTGMAEYLEGSKSNGPNDSSGNRLVWIIVGVAAGLITLGISTYNSKLDRIELSLQSLTVDITKDISNIKAKVDQFDKLADIFIKDQTARATKFGEIDSQLKMLTRNQEYTDDKIKSLAESLTEFRKEMRKP